MDVLQQVIDASGRPKFLKHVLFGISSESLSSFHRTLSCFFLEVMRSRTERPEGNRKSLITVVTRALEIIMGRKRRKKKIEDRIIHNPTPLSRTFDNKILENKHKLAIFTKFIPHPYLRLHLLLPQKMGQIPLKRIRNC